VHRAVSAVTDEIAPVLVGANSTTRDPWTGS